MARPKKVALSPQVGTVSQGRKRGNPDFVSSSFYVPKKVNIRFDKSLLTLKSEGFDLDRSDILSVLMDRFSIAVDAAEKEGGEMDLESILATASEAVVSESGEVSALKKMMRKTVEENRFDLEELREMKSKVDEFQQKADEHLATMKASYSETVEGLIRFVPDEADKETVRGYLRLIAD